MRSTGRLPDESASAVVESFAVGCRETALAVLAWTVTTGLAVAFWTAVLLPLAYVPLVVAGFSPVVDLSVFGKLVALNVVALVVGQFHDTTGQARGS